MALDREHCPWKHGVLAVEGTLGGGIWCNLPTFAEKKTAARRLIYFYFFKLIYFNWRLIAIL